MRSADLRLLLERTGSYPIIEAAAASGALRDVLPVRLFEHIGVVYQRVERAADPHAADLTTVRLAALLHEEPQASVWGLLVAAGFQDYAPIVMGVIGGFGALWKLTADHAFTEYVTAQQPHLASLLLFELAHEGRATDEMERAATRGGLEPSFTRWVERLSAAPALVRSGRA